MDMKNEDKMTVKRIASRLSFVRKDLEDIEKLEIKSEKIKELVRDMREKADLLFNACIPVLREL